MGVSQKLESLRKGFNIGHCIYAREPIVPGNQAPGVEGCYDKKQRRSLGFTDADLQERFRSGIGAVKSGGGGAASGKLMDEATIKRMMAAERKKELGEPEEKKAKRKADRSSSRSRGRKQFRS